MEILKYSAIGAAIVLQGCSCNASEPTPSDQGVAMDAGRVTLHRLNIAEYNNTVQDLLGTRLAPADDFPADDTNHGFDNMAATLTISPLHVEMYELAAEALAEDALALPQADPTDNRFQAEDPADVTASTGGASGDYFNLWSNGELTATVEAPDAGMYEFSARMYAQQAGPDFAMAALIVDGLALDTFDVIAETRDDSEIHSVEVELAAGNHSISVSFLNDFYDPGNGADRNLLVDWLNLYGPTDAEPGANTLRDALIPCDPGGETCAHETLRGLATRAFRRPVTAQEMADLMDLFDYVQSDGGDWDDGVKVGLRSILLSPHFLYRVEIDPQPESEFPSPLTDYELASRLSYFLWSTMPDDELFALAAEGRLQDEEQIATQVRRMLDDPRAQSLVENFAGQWLYIRAIDDANVDTWEYPDFDEDLRASMKGEMTRFFETFVHSDRDMRELLTATEGEIDARLAEHYGIDGVTDWTEVDLSADRGGLLGQAGLLTINAYPTRTSPVLRGKWVLANLLCDEPPPPPPGVEGLIDDNEDASTLREKLEQHRADPACASCHNVMDPIGLGLEHYDRIGAWRDTDQGYNIDASGELPDGTSFYGAQELSAILAEDPRLTHCMTEKLFTYGLGRSPVFEDNTVLGQIEEEFAASGHTFEALAVAVATSAPFRMRRGEKP